MKKIKMGSLVKAWDIGRVRDGQSRSQRKATFTYGITIGQGETIGGAFLIKVHLVNGREDWYASDQLEVLAG